MPGYGKTSISKLLSKKLWIEVIDFDDDIIEIDKIEKAIIKFLK
jgi:shikimate kinase